MWCHYCDKNNHNTADCRAIAKLKQQKKNKACFEAKAGPGKSQLKPEKTASSKKRNKEG
jgi:hypothetical protein